MTNKVTWTPAEGVIFHADHVVSEAGDLKFGEWVQNVTCRGCPAEITRWMLSEICSWDIAPEIESVQLELEQRFLAHVRAERQ